MDAKKRRSPPSRIPSASESKNELYAKPLIELSFKSTSTGNSFKVDDPVYPDRVRFIRKGKDAGSLMTIVYTKLSVSVPPPAVAPVAVTVKV